MRVITSCLLLFTITLALGQVEMNVPVLMSGPDGERTIEGLSTPLVQDAALTVEATLLGMENWASATVVGQAITLVPSVELASYREGQLVRFVAPSDVFDSITLRSTGLPEFQLLRPDGVRPVRGQVRTGAICEVLFAGDRWVLLNAPERACPTGTLQLNDRLCMEVVDAGNLFFYGAAERCAGMGARLCSWDEFYSACVQHGAELSGLFDAWEWLDDSSNHANSAVQVGFGTCAAQRWANPQSVTLGHSRCCFEPR